MKRPSPIILHATATSIMAWGWINAVDLPIVKQAVAIKGGPLLYLSNQGLLLAWTCMTVSLFRDAFPSVAVIHILKQTLLMISMPLALFISCIYWPSRLFCPQLIATVDIPLTMDLVFHAAPTITLSIDFFVFESKFSKTYVHGAAPVAAVAFSAGYASFVEYCSTFNGSYPYPFLAHSPFLVRVLIYTSTAGISLGCFRMLNALHA